MRPSRVLRGVAALARYRHQYGYYGGIRLIEALLVRFHHCCEARGITLSRRNFTIIPMARSATQAEWLRKADSTET